MRRARKASCVGTGGRIFDIMKAMKRSASKAGQEARQPTQRTAVHEAGAARRAVSRTGKGSGRPRQPISRYLGVIFIAAVIVPSVLLAVISLRAAGREEAYVEVQLSRTLLSEDLLITGMINAETEKIRSELAETLEVAAAANPGKSLAKWKADNPLVSVPFFVTSAGLILWPASSTGRSGAEEAFLRENKEFLGNRAFTPVYQNIAFAFQDTILAESERLLETGRSRETAPSKVLKAVKDASAAPAVATAADASGAPTQAAVKNENAQAPAVIGAAEQTKAAPAQVPAALDKAPAAVNAVPPAANATASPVVPESTTAVKMRANSPDAPIGRITGADAEPSPVVGPAAGFEADRKEAVKETEISGTGDEVKKAVDSLSVQQAAVVEDKLAKQKAVEIFAQSDTIRSKVYQEAQQKGDVTNTRVVQPVAQSAQAANRQEQSLYISEEMSFGQITGTAPSGIIPRFVGEKLTFLFWEKQDDGGIAGCEMAASVLKPRLAAVISDSYTPTRILAVLDEKGEPLSVPAGAGNRDWRRPFVSQEIGETFPRWEVASYLTSPQELSARARASALTIWIMVIILFISVAGGGTLVLTSLNAEVRMARNKSTFVTNVSHELKTPLTSISLFVELLRKGRRSDPKKVGQYLSLISGETERLTRLINNVLDFSSIEKGRRRYSRSPVDLVPICRDLFEGQRLRLESREFSVEFSSCAQSVYAEADAEAVKQAVLNLVSNAEKYSPDIKEIQVHLEREEGFAVIHVRDRGSGVPEHLREKIFQEFFRVDDSLTSRVKGTGLGLTIARRIARDLGGDLVCSARAGGGSDFALKLAIARVQGAVKGAEA
jgi:signal transduction histidine kinase